MNRPMIVAEWQRATESLRAADTLAREGLRADAVSRAYYAILHATKAALHVQDVAAESHAAVRRMLACISFTREKSSASGLHISPKAWTIAWVLTMTRRFGSQRKRPMPNAPGPQPSWNGCAPTSSRKG